MKNSELELFEKLKGTESIKPTAPSEGGEVEKEMAKGDPDFSTPLTIRNLFTHHDAHPVVLDFALLKVFGPEWYGWESETIYTEIQRAFSTQISEHARAKIQAIKTIHLNTKTWESWQVFEKVIQGLNNNIPRWDIMQIPTLEQLYAGVDILNQLRSEEFSQEVKSYIAAAVLHDDVFYVPPPLDFVQAEVAQPYFHCNDCGNEDSALFHDGICDTCTNKFDPEHGLSFRPDSQAVADGKGKNLTLKLRFNPDETEALWKKVETLPLDKVELDETMAGVQVAKLLVARDYMNVRRRQLAEQLISLKSWLGSV